MLPFFIGLPFFYILYSSDLDKFYLGHTNSEVNERLRRHLSDHSGFTSRAKDWRVVYTESFDTKKEAYARERRVKSWKNRAKVEQLIKSSDN